MNNVAYTGSVGNDQPIQGGKGTTIAACIACEAAVGYRFFAVGAGATYWASRPAAMRPAADCVWQLLAGRRPGKGRPQVLWNTMDNSKAARQLTENKGGREVDWDVSRVVARMPDSSGPQDKSEETDFSWLQDQLARVDGSDNTIVIAVIKKD